jgi:hypothetical protein
MTIPTEPPTEEDLTPTIAVDGYAIGIADPRDGHALPGREIHVLLEFPRPLLHDVQGDTVQVALRLGSTESVAELIGFLKSLCPVAWPEESPTNGSQERPDAQPVPDPGAGPDAAEPG